jgi:spore photoproduct lyase
VRRYVPEEICIDREALDSTVARTVLARAGRCPVRILDAREAPPAASVRDGKRRLLLQRHAGTFLRHCPAGTAGLVCCSYLVVNLASNCPMDCSYCFLQDYLAGNGQLKAFTNVEDALREIDAVLRARPDRSFRIGTGELADSLALDPLTGLSRLLVPFFARHRNATLELKTKTDCVDELLDLDPAGRVVVSWSVNAAVLVAREEAGTASLEERVAAAQRVQGAGYRIGLHFDPLIEFDGWEAGYGAAVETIFSAIDPSAVAWVSLGSLRVSRSLRRAIRARGLPQPVLGSELVEGADGKARVWRGLRLRMYALLVERLRAVDPHLPIYLCMEPASIWSRVMGEVPSDRELGMRLAAGAPW